MDNERKALQTWYILCILAGGLTLPLLLISVLILHLSIETGITVGGLGLLILAIVIPAARFKNRGQSEKAGWITTGIAVAAYLFGYVIVGWPTLQIAKIYWRIAPIRYHLWIGPVLFLVILSPIIYLDKRLQNLLKSR